MVMLMNIRQKVTDQVSLGHNTYGHVDEHKTEGNRSGKSRSQHIGSC